MIFARKILFIAAVACFLSAVQPVQAQQGQKLRADVTAAQNAKRSFELDLKKYTQKNPQLDRTAGKAKKEWHKNNRKRGKKKTETRSGTTRDKNYTALNR